jgi:hypothetical protein
MPNPRPVRTIITSGVNFMADKYLRPTIPRIGIGTRMGNLKYRLRIRYKKIKWNPIIFLKWFIDRFHLPLEKEHYELYAIIHAMYLNELGRLPRLANCKDFNDHIQWLKLFDQSDTVILCSDKIAVRSFISDRIGSDFLPAIYQIQKRFEDLNIDELPKSFVIKTNHDSGTVLLVKNKADLDTAQARCYFGQALGRFFGWEFGEWAYSCIEPKVFVEEYLQPESSAPPPDYKFQCVNGEVKFCRYTYDRGIDTKEIVLDRDGIDMGFIIDENFKQGAGFIKPQNWQQMVEIAEKLSGDFKAVRVDMYDVSGRIYVGEFTFFPYYGAYKGEGQKKVGKFMKFDRCSFKKPLYNQRKISF